MDMKEREIQYCNPEELIPYEKNPRDNRAALDAIELSIEEYGFTNPILVNEEKVILAGHTRREAAILAGLEKVPYIVVDGLTELSRKPIDWQTISYQSCLSGMRIYSRKSWRIC